MGLFIAKFLSIGLSELVIIHREFIDIDAEGGESQARRDGNQRLFFDLDDDFAIGIDGHGYVFFHDITFQVKRFRFVAFSRRSGRYV
jgi:hypothetical protein